MTIKPTKEFVAVMEFLKSVTLTIVIVVPLSPILFISIILGILFFIPTLGWSITITKASFCYVDKLVIKAHKHFGIEVE